MKNIFLFIVIVSLFLSCKDSNLDKRINKSFNHKNLEIDYDNSNNLILEYQDFELQYNQIFQQNLQISSKEYYDNVIEIFIEQETDFFKLFGELWDRPFKSENERKKLWKLKIERYFSSTRYLTHINNEVTIYTDGINNQRNNGISKALGIKISSNLKLPIQTVISFTAKNETVENIINKINKEIIDQLADTALGFTPEIIITILGIFGIWEGVKLHRSIPIVFLILLGGFFFWRSYTRQNKIREILKTESKKALNNTKIDYLEQLNKNTINYYSQLEKINYEANK